MRCDLLAMVLLACALCGCSEPEMFEHDLAVREVRLSLHILSTNVSVRTIRNTGNAFADIAKVTGQGRQTALVDEWISALMSIECAGIPLVDRYAVIHEVSDVLNSDVPSVLRCIGIGYDEVWELHFRALAWLDAQLIAMKPKVVKVTDLNFRTLHTEWTSYQALAEWREVIVENHERFDFDKRLYESGMERMEDIRKRFEQMIGRPVRPMSEIRSLGNFQRIVAERIAKQRAKALGEE